MLTLDQACRRLGQDLFDGLPQVDRLRLMAESKLSRKSLTVAPLFDLNSGDQSSLTRSCDTVLSAQVAAAQSMFDVRSFDIDNLARASYAVVPASEATVAGNRQAGVRLRAVLIDAKNGAVLSRAGALARADGSAQSPTPFFRDSPIIVRDDVLVSHGATLKGTAANPHPRLLQDLRVRAQLARPIEMYNGERYPEALREFKSVASSGQGDTLTSQVGIYVAGTRVGAEADVARAGERIVERGIAARQLEFKIFFRPNTVTPYATPPFDTMRLIAPATRKFAASRLCLDIIGHTSRSGSEELNRALSLRRAQFIRDQMIAIDPAMTSKVSADGKGFSQTLIGNGRDDETDMADRRVEFRTRDC